MLSVNSDDRRWDEEGVPVLGKEREYTGNLRTKKKTTRKKKTKKKTRNKNKRRTRRSE